MNISRFQQLVELAKRRAAAHSLPTPNLDNLQTAIEKEKPIEVDLSSIGVREEGETKHSASEIEEAVSEVISETEVHKIFVSETEHPERKKRIVLNAKQSEFKERVVAGEDLVFIGAAGTGKTTSVKETTEALISTVNEFGEEIGNAIPKLTTSTKHLVAGVPGIAIVSYTRKAVNNIRYSVVDILKPHTLTIHKLLEFAPEFFDIEDPTNPGMWKHSMRFVPTRNRFNPLPAELKLVIHEESSMESAELYDMLEDALPHKHQEVFIGDIQQLPPIFGSAILGFKLTSLPVIELTEIYRQALNSPIISLAWEVLKGNAKTFSSTAKTVPTKLSNGATVSRKTIPALDKFSRTAFDEDNRDEGGKAKHLGTVKIQTWQKKLSPDLALLTIIKQFTAWEKDTYYNPAEDVILCPFNKAFGTVEINIGISNYLGKKRGATVHEVIAGFRIHYLAVGDRVLYDKEDAVIVSIRTNGNYMGKSPRIASVNMDRTGGMEAGLTEEERMRAAEDDDPANFKLEAMEAFLETAAENVEDRVQAASHVIGVQFTHPEADDKEIALDSAAEINNLLGGYAITVHKFQGSQAKKVFIVLHHSHSVMLCRELLYTAITRAEIHLHIICEPDSLEKGVKSQRIKGNTIEEKAEQFKGKMTPAEKERQERKATEKKHQLELEKQQKQDQQKQQLEKDKEDEQQLQTKQRDEHEIQSEHSSISMETEREETSPKDKMGADVENNSSVSNNPSILDSDSRTANQPDRQLTPLEKLKLLRKR